MAGDAINEKGDDKGDLKQSRLPVESNERPLLAGGKLLPTDRLTGVPSQFMDFNELTASIDRTLARLNKAMETPEVLAMLQDSLRPGAGAALPPHFEAALQRHETLLRNALEPKNDTKTDIG